MLDLSRKMQPYFIDFKVICAISEVKENTG